MTESVRRTARESNAALEFATGTLGVSEVRATTLDDNPASARVLEKLGFAALEAGATEVDSRGDERRVTRWVLHRVAKAAPRFGGRSA
jgi:RimJ/RimL family protein N-acetyltransferase